MSTDPSGTVDRAPSRPTPVEALWDRVAALYQQKTGDTLDQEALHESFADARAEMRQAAMENRIARLVEEGVIEQDEADEYLEWWQEKPDTPIKPGFRGHRSSRGRCVPPAPAG